MTERHHPTAKVNGKYLDSKFTIELTEEEHRNETRIVQFNKIGDSFDGATLLGQMQVRLARVAATISVTLVTFTDIHRLADAMFAIGTMLIAWATDIKGRS
jgi:hypothetical protein